MVFGGRPTVLLAALGTALALAVPSPAGAALTSSWSQVSSPNPGRSVTANEITGLACTTEVTCWAVGQMGGYVLRWNGLRFVATRMPDALSSPVAVSCVGPSFCASVVGAMSWVWNGSAWRPVAATAAPPNSSLQSVSCTSPTFCVAAGYAYGRTGGATTTVALRWNGATWQHLATPDDGPRGSSLTSVACVTASFCEAVGGFTSAPNRLGEETTKVLAERWNGTAWALQAIPTAQYDESLRSISCAGTSRCVAVGGGGDVQTHPVALAYDGARWSSLAPPDYAPATSVFGEGLGAVSCASAQSCLVVGEDDASVVILSLVRTSFTRERAATPRGFTAVGGAMDAVACSPSFACIAGGYVDQVDVAERN